MEPHHTRPEVVAARQEGVGRSTRRSRTVKTQMMYVALPVRDSDRLLGYVRASLSLAALDERLARLRRLVALGAAIAALIALAIGLVIARRITRPLASMTAVAEAMAAGEFSRRVPARSGDEIGQLARAFNSMAEQMEQRIGAMTQDNNTLQTILSGMVEGVIAVDMDERIVHMNAVAGGILGVDPERVGGGQIWNVTRIHQISSALRDALDGVKGARSEAIVLRDDGECAIEILASPLHDGADALVGAVVVFHDVSEMRRLELVRREFVVNASHELKTPITAIRGFLETLVEDSEMPLETRVAFLRRASSQSERLASLVTDLLQLSRLESGEEKEEFERLDLQVAVRQSVGEFKSTAESKGVDLRLACAEDEVPIHGDMAALGLIIDNLVDNAIKYTDKGGSVHVRASCQDGAAVLEVEDTGIGIEKAQQDRIFERFYRVDKARSRQLGGTGLGLAIVKHACGVLNAQLTVESEPGVGSTFTVRFAGTA